MISKPIEITTDSSIKLDITSYLKEIGADFNDNVTAMCTIQPNGKDSTFVGYINTNEQTGKGLYIDGDKMFAAIPPKMFQFEGFLLVRVAITKINVNFADKMEVTWTKYHQTNIKIVKP